MGKDCIRAVYENGDLVYRSSKGIEIARFVNKTASLKIAKETPGVKVEQIEKSVQGGCADIFKNGSAIINHVNKSKKGVLTLATAESNRISFICAVVIDEPIGSDSKGKPPSFEIGKLLSKKDCVMKSDKLTGLKKGQSFIFAGSLDKDDSLELLAIPGKGKTTGKFTVSTIAFN